MIPPLLLGRRPRPVTTDHRTLLAGRSGLAYGAWSEPHTDHYQETA